MVDEVIFAIVPLFGIIFGCALVIVAIWLGVRARTRRLELMTELQNKVLDKFGTSTEFVDFMKTPEGRQWMSNSTENRTRQADRILSSLRWGLITAAFGGAFLLLAVFAERDLIYPGLLIGSIGVGFLAHSFLAAKLARKWGLMPPEQGDVAGD
jgi:hypothetical protein